MSAPVPAGPLWPGTYFDCTSFTTFSSSGLAICHENPVVRLLTPIGMRYEETYARAYPFDKLVDGLFQPKMVEEAVTLVQEILAQDAVVYLIINNRAGGNAPMITKKVVERFIAFGQ